MVECSAKEYVYAIETVNFHSAQYLWKVHFQVPKTEGENIFEFIN